MLTEDVEAWGPCWHTVKMQCGGGREVGLASVEQLPFVMEGWGTLLRSASPPDEVKFDKSMIIHRGQLLGTQQIPHELRRHGNARALSPRNTHIQCTILKNVFIEPKN